MYVCIRYLGIVVLHKTYPIARTFLLLLSWKMMPSSKFYCHPSEKGDAKKSSSHFSGLTFAEQPHPLGRTNERTKNEQASEEQRLESRLLREKEESWGKQPNSLNTRSKKAINLEAKWKIGPSEYLIQEKSQGCCSLYAAGLKLNNVQSSRASKEKTFFPHSTTKWIKNILT